MIEYYCKVNETPQGIESTEYEADRDQAIWDSGKKEGMRELLKRIETTASWHNGILHYSPDAWESLKKELGLS